VEECKQGDLDQQQLLLLQLLRLPLLLDHLLPAAAAMSFAPYALQAPDTLVPDVMLKQQKQLTWHCWQRQRQQQQVAAAGTARVAAAVAAAAAARM
jgi:hypothetical protein